MHMPRFYGDSQLDRRRAKWLMLGENDGQFIDLALVMLLVFFSGIGFALSRAIKRCPISSLRCPCTLNCFDQLDLAEQVWINHDLALIIVILRLSGKQDSRRPHLSLKQDTAAR